MVAKANKGTGEGSALTTVLFVFLLASLVTGLAAFTLHTRYLESMQRYLPHASELRLLPDRISGYAYASGTGDEEAFAGLMDSRQEFVRLLDELKNGSQDGMPAVPESIRPLLQEIESTWLELRSQVDAILNSKTAIMSVHGAIDGISSAIPDLLRVSALAATGMLESNASKGQVYYATRQFFIAQRINTAISEILAGRTVSTLAVDRIGRDLNELKSVVHALLTGGAELGFEVVDDANIQPGLLEVSAVLGDMDDSLRVLQEELPNALPALQALSVEGEVEAAGVAEVERQPGEPGELADIADALEQKLSDLAVLYSGATDNLMLGPVKVDSALISLLDAVAIALLLILGMLLFANAKKRKRFSAEREQRQQEAVHRLQDEMSHMADGDLSVEANADEDATGVIADSVNQISEAMRGMVISIKDAATRAYSSVHENRANVMHLAEATEHQREQIGAASSKVNTISQALTVMATEADGSANAAAQSVELVEKGTEAVRQTVSGMNKIGEQIHQASACVKRLDGNLQEAGEMVELVEDIADQTNILALNAAMQAAVAGEAGRGFSVVADGVQRQAERFSSVTKQLEAMVQAIQAESSKALNSMEHSAAEVVSGTDLSESTGRIMQEIEAVSKRVSELASRFAEYAQVQSRSAVSISDSMGVIREIGQQNCENTDNAVLTIGELAGHIDDIRESVYGFVLPDREQSN